MIRGGWGFGFTVAPLYYRAVLTEPGTHPYAGGWAIHHKPGYYRVLTRGGGGGGGGRNTLGVTSNTGEGGFDTYSTTTANVSLPRSSTNINSFRNAVVGGGGRGGSASSDFNNGGQGGQGGASLVFGGFSSTGGFGGRGAGRTSAGPSYNRVPQTYGGYGASMSPPWVNDRGEDGKPGEVQITRLA